MDPNNPQPVTRISSYMPIPQPEIAQQKSLIIAWLLFWPWSLLWCFLVHNPARYLLHLVSSEVKATMDSIAQETFNEIAQDFQFESQASRVPIAMPVTSPMRDPRTR